MQNRVNGRSERITIGQYGVFAPDQARDIAREHLRTMRTGYKPNSAGKSTCINVYYVTPKSATLTLKDKSLKASSQSEIRRHVTTSF